MSESVGAMQTVDVDGNVIRSSKRIMGTSLIISGGVLLAGIGITAIFRPITDAAAALEAGQSLVITGASLLGVGVLDGLGKAIGRAVGGGK